ncbi:MAG: hypothetical protein IPG99_08495 [Ignavibacteria bacterium]|nr:hypothetical protein [Ignavibacteria bacterium]
MKILLPVLILAGLLFTNTDTFSQKKQVKKDSVLTKEKHPQDSPEGRGFFIESKSGESTLRILGSVRMFGSNDFNGLSGGTGFSIGDIPIDTGNLVSENTFFLTANISRVGIEVTKKMGFGNVFARIETDFNGGGQNFRIRHAYGQTDFLLTGQTWTCFSDIETLPNTVDLDGPPTAISKRTVQIRYYKSFEKYYKLLASLEAPSISVSIPDTLSLEPVTQSLPAFAVNLERNSTGLSLTAAGIINPISVRNLNGSKESLFGAGALLSSKVVLGKTTNIVGQILFGSGIASFLNLSDNVAFDVILNPLTEKYELTQSYGGFISLSQKLFKKKVDLNVAIGGVNFVMEDYFSPQTFELGYYVSVNAFMLLLERSKIGIEYSYGNKRIKNGDRGDANRFAFTFFFDF